MAANLKSPIDSNPVLERYHIYHAEAHLLSGHLEHPIKQPIEHYGKVVLENTRRETLTQQSVGETSIEGLISFKSGHTRVIGTHLNTKTDIFGNDHAGWVTLSTAVLEGFNVVDILTADRVVAQVSTRHPMTDGHVPEVTFLGTRFENLRVGGIPVEVELDLALCGPKPEKDKSYLQDSGFLDRVERQLDGIASSNGLPQELEKKVGAEVTYIDSLRKGAKSGAKSERNGYSRLQCSLIKTIKPIPIPGVRTFGNMIFVPNFGTISLAELEVGIGPGHGDFAERSKDGLSTEMSNSNYFTLNMFNLQLGCPLGAKANGPKVSSNGTTAP